MISNQGYKQYTKVEKGSLISLNEKAIEESASWDGFHGIAISSNADISLSDALHRYKDLWRIEETFRVAKSTLQARPMFHWKPRRIRAHILLCFMTLFFERFLEYLLRRTGESSLTPDQIRHALSGVHTVFFEKSDSKQEGKMESALSKDAKIIFKILGILQERKVTMQ